MTRARLFLFRLGHCMAAYSARTVHGYFLSRRGPGNLESIDSKGHFRNFFIFSIIKNDFLHFLSSLFDWEWAF